MDRTIVIGRKNWNSIVSSAIAMVAVGAFTTSLLAQELDAKLLLKQMGAEIAGLDSFILNGDAYTDARLAAGQIIEHSSQVSLRLRRNPGAIHITNRDTENTKEIFFADGLLSVFSKKDNFYAQREIPKGVQAMLDFAVNEVGIEAPLLDFVSANIADDLIKDAEAVRYLGTSLIRDEVFHHIGIRSPDVDVQLWIATKGPPLPGKLVITSKWEGGSPRFVAFFEWKINPDLPSNAFKFEPPDGAVAVEFLLDLE
jgi:hypothetical protein